MALIPQNELSKLQTAYSARKVASTAAFEAEKMAIAKLINSTANTGELSAIYNHPISDAMKSVLKNNGYIVTQNPKQYCVDPTTQYTISCDDSIKYPDS